MTLETHQATCSRCRAHPRTVTHRWCKNCQTENRRALRAKQGIGRIGPPVKFTPPSRMTGDQQRVPDYSKLIALIPKHRGESIGIQIVHFQGHWAVDVRIGYNYKRRGLQPTRRGVTFSARLLPRIIATLEQAREAIRRQAIAQGVMGAMAPPHFDPEPWLRQYRK